MEIVGCQVCLSKSGSISAFRKHIQSDLHHKKMEEIFQKDKFIGTGMPSLIMETFNTKQANQEPIIGLSLLTVCFSPETNVYFYLCHACEETCSPDGIADHVLSWNHVSNYSLHGSQLAEFSWIPNMNLNHEVMKEIQTKGTGPLQMLDLPEDLLRKLETSSYAEVMRSLSEKEKLLKLLEAAEPKRTLIQTYQSESNRKHPLLGLQHLVECICIGSDKKKHYLCTLCDLTFASHKIIKHVLSLDHIFCYIEAWHPTTLLAREKYKNYLTFSPMMLNIAEQAENIYKTANTDMKEVRLEPDQYSSVNFTCYTEAFNKLESITKNTKEGSLRTNITPGNKLVPSVSAVTGTSELEIHCQNCRYVFSTIIQYSRHIRSFKHNEKLNKLKVFSGGGSKSTGISRPPILQFYKYLKNRHLNSSTEVSLVVTFICSEDKRCPFTVCFACADCFPEYLAVKHCNSRKHLMKTLLYLSPWRLPLAWVELPSVNDLRSSILEEEQESGGNQLMMKIVDLPSSIFCDLMPHTHRKVIDGLRHTFNFLKFGVPMRETQRKLKNGDRFPLLGTDFMVSHEVTDSHDKSRKIAFVCLLCERKLSDQECYAHEFSREHIKTFLDCYHSGSLNSDTDEETLCDLAKQAGLQHPITKVQEILLKKPICEPSNYDEVPRGSLKEMKDRSPGKGQVLESSDNCEKTEDKAKITKMDCADRKGDKRIEKESMKTTEGLKSTGEEPSHAIKVKEEEEPMEVEPSEMIEGSKDLDLKNETGQQSNKNIPTLLGSGAIKEEEMTRPVSQESQDKIENDEKGKGIKREEDQPTSEQTESGKAKREETMTEEGASGRPSQASVKKASGHQEADLLVQHLEKTGRMPVIGLSKIIQCRFGQKPLIYLCESCSVKIQQQYIIPHVSGISHHKMYLLGLNKLPSLPGSYPGMKVKDFAALFERHKGCGETQVVDVNKKVYENILKQNFQSALQTVQKFQAEQRNTAVPHDKQAMDMNTDVAETSDESAQSTTANNSKTIFTFAKTAAPTPKSASPTPKSVAPISENIAPTIMSVTPATESVGNPSKSFFLATKSVALATEGVTTKNQSATQINKSFAPSTKSVAPSTKSVAPTTKSVAPTTKSVAPTTKSVGPTTKSVAPSTKSVAPTTKSVPPTTQSGEINKSFASTRESVTSITKNVASATKNVAQTTKKFTPPTERVNPTTKSVKPTTKNVPPTTQNVAPAPKSVTPTAKSVTPTAKSVTPTAKSVTPTAKSVTPTAKSVTPTAKSVTPTAKSVTPTAKSVTPTAKSVTPTAKSVTPTAKSVTPTAKSVTPTAKSVTPIAKSVPPTTQNVAPAQKSATSTTKSVPPTAKSVPPTTQSVAPTGKSVTLTAKSVAPTAKSVAPTAKSVAPTAKSVAPTAKSVAPTAKSVAPTAKSVAPTAKSVAPTAKSVAPTAPNVAPAAPSVAPAAPSVAPAAPSVAPAARSVAPATPSVAPAAPSVAPAAPSVAPAAPSVARAAQSVAPSAQSLDPAAPSVAPSAPSVAPSAPSVAPAAKSVAPTTKSLVPLGMPSTPKIATLSMSHAASNTDDTQTVHKYASTTPSASANIKKSPTAIQKNYETRTTSKVPSKSSATTNTSTRNGNSATTNIDSGNAVSISASFSLRAGENTRNSATASNTATLTARTSTRARISSRTESTVHEATQRSEQAEQTDQLLKTVITPATQAPSVTTAQPPETPVEFGNTQGSSQPAGASITLQSSAEDGRKKRIWTSEPKVGVKYLIVVACGDKRQIYCRLCSSRLRQRRHLFSDTHKRNYVHLALSGVPWRQSELSRKINDFVAQFAEAERKEGPQRAQAIRVEMDVYSELANLPEDKALEKLVAMLAHEDSKFSPCTSDSWTPEFTFVSPREPLSPDEEIDMPRRGTVGLSPDIRSQQENKCALQSQPAQLPVEKPPACVASLAGIESDSSCPFTQTSDASKKTSEKEEEQGKRDPESQVAQTELEVSEKTTQNQPESGSGSLQYILMEEKTNESSLSRFLKVKPSDSETIIGMNAVWECQVMPKKASHKTFFLCESCRTRLYLRNICQHMYSDRHLLNHMSRQYAEFMDFWDDEDLLHKMKMELTKDIAKMLCEVECYHKKDAQSTLLAQDLFEYVHKAPFDEALSILQCLKEEQTLSTPCPPVSTPPLKGTRRNSETQQTDPIEQGKDGTPPDQSNEHSEVESGAAPFLDAGTCLSQIQSEPTLQISEHQRLTREVKQTFDGSISSSSLIVSKKSIRNPGVSSKNKISKMKRPADRSVETLASSLTGDPQPQDPVFAKKIRSSLKPNTESPSESTFVLPVATSPPLPCEDVLTDKPEKLMELIDFINMEREKRSEIALSMEDPGESVASFDNGSSTGVKSKPDPVSDKMISTVLHKETGLDSVLKCDKDIDMKVITSANDRNQQNQGSDDACSMPDIMRNPKPYSNIDASTNNQGHPSTHDANKETHSTRVNLQPISPTVTARLECTDRHVTHYNTQGYAAGNGQHQGAELYPCVPAANCGDTLGAVYDNIRQTGHFTNSPLLPHNQPLGAVQSSTWPVQAPANPSSVYQDEECTRRFFNPNQIETEQGANRLALEPFGPRSGSPTSLSRASFEKQWCLQQYEVMRRQLLQQHQHQQLYPHQMMQQRWIAERQGPYESAYICTNPLTAAAGSSQSFNNLREYNTTAVHSSNNVGTQNAPQAFLSPPNVYYPLPENSEVTAQASAKVPGLWHYSADPTVGNDNPPVKRM